MRWQSKAAGKIASQGFARIGRHEAVCGIPFPVNKGSVCRDGDLRYAERRFPHAAVTACDGPITSLPQRCWHPGDLPSSDSDSLHNALSRLSVAGTGFQTQLIPLWLSGCELTRKKIRAALQKRHEHGKPKSLNAAGKSGRVDATVTDQCCRRASDQFRQRATAWPADHAVFQKA